MQALANIATRLKLVREAHHRFLALYAVEVAVIEPAVELIAHDVQRASSDPFWDNNPATGQPVN